jgi:hypothetical protein
MNTRNERGSILLLVVIFTMIMSLLGFAIIYMDGNELMAVRRQVLNTRAALLADAGLEMGRGFLYYCDARLEDEVDMEIAENITHGNLPHNGQRYKAFQAMQPFPGHGNAHGRKVGDGTYYLFARQKIDEAYPEAWCDVWISSATDNLSSTDGVYEYVISARGVASYGADGAVDAVKNEIMKVRISSITVPAATTDSRYIGWPTCAWPSCRFYLGGAATKHLPDMAMNMGSNAAGNKTRYFFQYFRDTGKAFGEEPTEYVVH